MLICSAKENCVSLKCHLNEGQRSCVGRFGFGFFLLRVLFISPQAKRSLHCTVGLSFCSFILRASSYCLSKHKHKDVKSLNCSLKCSGHDVACLDLHMNIQALSLLL